MVYAPKPQLTSIGLVDKYIDNNALKWVLMHGENPPMRVIEPLDSFRWPMDEWWTGVGNVELIGEKSKLAAFKLSRSIPREEIAAVVERCLGAVKGAAVYVVWNRATGKVERRFQR